MNLSVDIRELRYRSLYGLASWLLASLFVSTLYEDTLFALTPAIPSVFVYSAPWEVLLAHIELSLFLGACLTLPHILWNFYAFLRPGLFLAEANLFHFNLTLWLIGPWFLYYAALLIVGWNIHSTSSFFFRYLPSIHSASSFISGLLLLCLSLAFMVNALTIAIRLWPRLFAKFRLHVIYAVAAALACFMPPDWSYLLAGFALTFLLVEGIYFAYLFKKRLSRC